MSLAIDEQQIQSADDDGSLALAHWLAGPVGLQLDVLTRQYLVFAFALEAAARGSLSAFTLNQLSTATQTADCARLLAWLPAQPHQSADILALLSQLCQQISSQEPQVLKGRLISLEGGDGSGKTTLSRQLAAKLDAIATRALGGAGGASAGLRALILRSEFYWHPLPELLLTAAIYRETLLHVILPALREGKTVVTDRWLDTLSVYMRNDTAGVPPSIIEQAYDILVADVAPRLRPDMTFLLDLPYDVALARRTSRPVETGKLDRNEAKGDAFHMSVFGAYRALAGTAPRFVLVDASQSESDVLTRLLQFSRQDMDQS